MSEPSFKETLFAACAVSDQAFAGAYDALGPEKRTRLKACIAALYESLGETPVSERRERTFRQGFVLVEQDCGPVPQVTLVCQASYPHPQGLLAAVMPALNAGARPDVLFLDRVERGAGRIVPDLLAALELAGVEEAWLLDEARALDFFRRAEACINPGVKPGSEPGAPSGPAPGTESGAPSGAAHGNGRLLLLGESFFGEALLLEAHRRGTLCRFLSGLPAFAPDAAAGRTEPVMDFVPFWPHLEPGWFRQRTRLAATSNRK